MSLGSTVVWVGADGCGSTVHSRRGFGGGGAADGGVCGVVGAMSRWMAGDVGVATPIHRAVRTSSINKRMTSTRTVGVEDLS